VAYEESRTFFPLNIRNKKIENDKNKLEFETTFIDGAELITKVIYNKKEIVNEITDPLITNYNTYATLKF
jgi:hypothetical protein